MNTNFQAIGLTRLGIKPDSTPPEADALTTRPSEQLNGRLRYTHLFSSVQLLAGIQLGVCFTGVVRSLMSHAHGVGRVVGALSSEAGFAGSMLN